MPRGRTEDDDSALEKAAKPPPPLNAPFRDLGKLVKVTRTMAPAAKPAPSRRPEAPVDDAALFRSATSGSRPLAAKAAVPPAPKNPQPALRPGVRDDAEALAALSDLVSGVGRFDVSDSDEHVEGMAIGLDARLLRKLRAGEFAVQAHLDLHGYTADEAKAEVKEFLFAALESGLRCVLVVHGRGHNSPDRRPVLKDGLKSWLTRGEIGRIVLAFSTARGCDGGSGASYVLLRRDRQKRPFATYEGAKR